MPISDGRRFLCFHNFITTLSFKSIAFMPKNVSCVAISYTYPVRSSHQVSKVSEFYGHEREEILRQKYHRFTPIFLYCESFAHEKQEFDKVSGQMH